MARKMAHGKRFKHMMDDGTSYDIFEAMDKMLEIHGYPVSESLMQQRLKHSTDPEYVFMAKGVKIPGGHPYTNLQIERRNNPKPKPKLKRKAKVKAAPKLTAQERALKAAYIAAGIAWI